MTAIPDKPMSYFAVPPAASSEPDGRRRRSEVSKARIVDALIALGSEGCTLPSAEAVAARAGVGLRTVFRLFKDMDSLYRGMQEVLVERLGPLIEGDLPGGSWRERLDALVDRRAQAFEIMLPLQIAADTHRARSPALQEGRVRLVRGQRETLRAILPEAVRNDAALMEPLDLVLSFEAWRRLRTDQALAPAEAVAIQKGMLARLLAGGAA